jgi:hypothetical protein
VLLQLLLQLLVPVMHTYVFKYLFYVCSINLTRPEVANSYKTPANLAPRLPAVLLQETRPHLPKLETPAGFLDVRTLVTFYSSFH